jgi:hypothetical protein
MWIPQIEKLEGAHTLKIAIHRDSSPIPFAETIQLWKRDSDFRSFFIRTLADAPFSAFRWETPAITAATSNRPFEFVLLDSPSLARAPDENAFAKHFPESTDVEVVEFANLGRDAILIVPCPKTSPSAYVHLASFLRHARDSQKHALWQLVGDAMTRRLSDNPVWLSTARAGVAWLHIRLDDRPKYFAHAPYRSYPPSP